MSILVGINNIFLVLFPRFWLLVEKQIITHMYESPNTQLFCAGWWRAAAWFLVVVFLNCRQKRLFYFQSIYSVGIFLHKNNQYGFSRSSSNKCLWSQIEPFCCFYQSCSVQNNTSVISSKFINKFMQKCQCYYTLSDQSIPLVAVTSVVFLLTE